MIYQFGEYELDTQLYELRRAGVPVTLEPQVFDGLAFLVENHDRMVTKDEMLEKIWGHNYISEAALNSRLMAARKAIGDSGREQRLIRTLRGRGFRFVGDVTTKAGVRPAAPAGDADVLTLAGQAVSRTAQRQTIRFCKTSDEVRIAYATVGEGPPIVKAPNWLTHLEYEWQNPVWRHWWQELARDHQVIRFDQRGCGLSDWNVENLSFEAWVEDLEAVVQAIGIESFALLEISQGGAVAIEYTVRHPEKVAHLILCGAYSRG